LLAYCNGGEVVKLFKLLLSLYSLVDTCSSFQNCIFCWPAEMGYHINLYILGSHGITMSENPWCRGKSVGIFRYKNEDACVHIYSDQYSIAKHDWKHTLKWNKCTFQMHSFLFCIPHWFIVHLLSCKSILANMNLLLQF
jgi:hypothetical protein